MSTVEVMLQKKPKPRSISGPIGKVFLQAFLILVAIVQIYPLIWLALFSLKDNSEIFSGDVAGLPKAFLWSNYTKAMSDGHVLTYFMNSVLVTAASIVLVLILSSMTGYAITRMNWKLSGLTMTIILLGMMVPIHAALLPLFIILKNLKPAQQLLVSDHSLCGIWHSDGGIHSGQFFQRYPKRDGGVGGYRRLRHIPDVFLYYSASGNPGYINGSHLHISVLLE